MSRCGAGCNPQNIKAAILEEIKKNRLEMECIKYNVKYVHDKKITQSIPNEDLIISNEILPSDQVQINDFICLMHNDMNDGIYKVLSLGSVFDFCVLESVKKLKPLS